MRNIIGIYNENLRLKYFKNTEVFDIFKDLIIENKDVVFTISEDKVCDFMNNLIVPLWYIYKEKIPELFLSSNVIFKEHWSEFDKSFKSKTCIVIIEDNKVYIKHYICKENDEKIDFSILRYDYIMFSNE